MMNHDHFYLAKNISFRDNDERMFAKESLIFNVTEDILVFMEDNEISKKELAKRLGKTKAYVTQVLDGARNMTLGTLSDFCFALGFKPEINMPVETLEPKIVDNSVPKKKAAWKTESVSTQSKSTFYVVDTNRTRTKSFEAPTWHRQQVA